MHGADEVRYRKVSGALRAQRPAVTTGLARWYTLAIRIRSRTRGRLSDGHATSGNQCAPWDAIAHRSGRSLAQLAIA